MKRGVTIASTVARLLFIAELWVGTAAPAGEATTIASCAQAIPDELSGDVVLARGCTYAQSLRVVQSHTRLDCSGSRFVGEGTRQFGLVIDSVGQPLSDIVIENCAFDGFTSSGVRVGWAIQDHLKPADRSMTYGRSPRKIVLDHLTVTNSGRVGIYVDDYVTELTLQNSEIRGSGGVGLYLEHSTAQNQVLFNRFIGNGLGQPGRATREAVAVDSSARNLIRGNEFIANGAGGIFLYKNCGEHFASGQQVLRWQHSNENVISQNTFTDEKIGVWLASRARRNLGGWGCGDKPSDERSGLYPDYADFNVVSENRFCRTPVPVRDHGRENRVSHSTDTCEDEPSYRRASPRVLEDRANPFNFQVSP